MATSVPNPVDLFLSPDLTEEDARAYLGTLGFRDPASADQCLQAMAEDMIVRETLGRVAGDLLPALVESPDPDAAVAALSHYLAARTGRAMFLDYLGEDPRAMHVLASVFGSSPFLSDILIRHPDYFHWLVSQVERSAPDRQDLEEEVEAMLAAVDDPEIALDLLRRWQIREVLRIATRDLLRGETVQTATAQLSDVTALFVERVLAVVRAAQIEQAGEPAPAGAFAVVAAGSLGGREMSYVGDLELFYVYDAPGADTPETRAFHARVARALTAALDHDGHGPHRVVLRPAPADGIWSFDELSVRCATPGARAERLGFVKARPIAGDPELCRRVHVLLQGFVYQGPPDRRVLAVRREQESGGVRDVEIFVQVMQLTHGGNRQALRQPNTLAALDALAAAGVVAEPVKRELEHAYVFFRSVELRTQLADESREQAMMRHLGLGSAEGLEKQLGGYRERVSRIYRGLFEGID